MSHHAARGVALRHAALSALAALAVPAAHAEPAATAAIPAATLASPSPVETILVIARPRAADGVASALTPARESRLATLSDLFRDAPGILVEPVFGGVDHPRLAVRGSGLQRGTMPAGRGVELRQDGLPLTYADTSYDFVEWLEPLGFGRVRILRGGRGVLAAGTALGGVIDFRTIAGGGPVELLARGEGSSFGGRRAQLAVAGGETDARGFVSGSWFQQKGFRQHNRQEAWRSLARVEAELAPSVTLAGSLLWSNSRLDLPGPLTLAQIRAGDRSAQPGNVRGDWRRRVGRTRGTVELAVDRGATRLDLAAGLMATDVDFRRRDVQVEDNRDWSAALRLAQDVPLGGRTATLGLDLMWQDGRRAQQLYLNGGGTIPSFTGQRGRLWADNVLRADRLSVVASLTAPLDDATTATLAAGAARHGRRITDAFPVRPARPAATLDRRYAGFTGLAVLGRDITPGLTLFASASRVMEPPTHDLLFINVAGMGAGNALVDGPNPRRPVIVNLDAQYATTAELGLKGEAGGLALDLTVYRGWLRGEFVSTADFVAQVVTSVGNARRTRRWGVEAEARARLAEPGWQSGDRLLLDARWTMTDARFAGDRVFGNRRLPIVPPHVIALGLAYDAPRGLTGALFASIVPEGGPADYAGTLRADGHYALGGRAALKLPALTLFVEGRNLTDRRYAATVVAAQNNLAGRDAVTFAPGEGRAVTLGAEARF